MRSKSSENIKTAETATPNSLKTDELELMNKVSDAYNRPDENSVHGLPILHALSQRSKHPS